MAVEGLKWRVNKAVRASRLMPAPARLIMWTLSDRADSTTGEIPEARTPSLAELAQETGLGESTVKRHLPSLERYGWVVRVRPSAEERARHKPTGYRLAVGAEGSDGSEGPEWAIEKSDSRAHGRPSPKAQSGPSKQDPRAQSGPTEGPERAIARAQSEPGTYIYDRNDQLHDQKRAATSAAIAPPAGRSAPPAQRVLHAVPDEPTAQLILGEYLDRCAKRPPAAVIGQLGKILKALLAEGIDPDDIRRGMAAWMAKGLHPATLPSVVNEVMNAAPLAQSRGRPANDTGTAAHMERYLARVAARKAAGGETP